MLTDAAIGIAAGVLGLAVVLTKLIHEVFRARKPQVVTDHAPHFKALFAKLDRQGKTIDEMVVHVRRRETEIAVDRERLKRMEQDLEALRGRKS